VRIALAVHGWPPELRGGTELGTRAMAYALVREGHEVLVIAGTLEHADPPRSHRTRELEPDSGRPFTVARIERPDLYFDHWQKGRSAPVGRAFDALLADFRPDVLHLQHWLRLSTDLVRRAARVGIPSVVTLHDHTTTCLLNWRAHPVEQAPCLRTFDPMGCAACAGHVPPKTPWVGLEQQIVRAASRQQDLGSELRVARAVIVPSQAHGESLLHLGLAPRSLLVVPPFGGVTFTPRPAPEDPAVDGALRVGAWGLSSPAKGAALIRQAVAEVDAPLPIELHLAGADAGEMVSGVHGNRVQVHGVYEPADLAVHAVTNVHLAVVGSLAEESHCLVADEAHALGLPLALPLSGAFPERFSEGDGVWFYPAADAGGLARLLDRAARDSEALGALRERVRPPDQDTAARVKLLVELYAEVVREGPPEVAVAEWFEEKLTETETAAWDTALSQSDPSELGFPAGD
jgi:glycosyltransferase involved in cell wall biosynthesis